MSGAHRKWTPEQRAAAAERFRRRNLFDGEFIARRLTGLRSSEKNIAARRIFAAAFNACPDVRARAAFRIALFNSDPEMRRRQELGKRRNRLAAKTNQGEQDAMNMRGKIKSHWRRDEIERAVALLKDTKGKRLKERIAVIAQEINRSPRSVEARYHNCGGTFDNHRSPTDREIHEAPPQIPPEVIEDRDLRLVQSPRSLIAFLMGDPLPGRSALERRA